jgi:hypothetical protein
MSAHPIIPGKLYRVRHAGRAFAVLAEHGCVAIVIVLRALYPERP